MSKEIKKENEKLISDAFMAALRALVAEKAESLTTELTIAGGKYLLSLTIKDLESEK